MNTPKIFTYFTKLSFYLPRAEKGLSHINGQWATSPLFRFIMEPISRVIKDELGDKNSKWMAGIKPLRYQGNILTMGSVDHGPPDHGKPHLHRRGQLVGPTWSNTQPQIATAKPRVKRLPLTPISKFSRLLAFSSLYLPNLSLLPHSPTIICILSLCDL